MSVDDRLRAAFDESDAGWAIDPDDALREVHHRHRQGVQLRRVAVATGLAAAVVAFAVVLTDRSGDDGTAPDPFVPAPSQTATFGETVLQGTWRTAVLDETDVRASLLAAGDAAYADQVVADLPDEPFRLRWRVDRGTATLSTVTVAGRSEVALDETSIVVDGDRVTISPRFSDGSNVHTFVIDGDALRLTLVSTSEPDTGGVPAEVWQRLLYDAVGFTRG